MRPLESFIGQPIRSLQTMLRVIARSTDNEPGPVPDGIYGPETIRAVSGFQRKHGIPVTGVADQDTWDAVVSAYEPALVEQDAAQPLQILLNPGQVIRRGDRHPNLYLVQAILLALSEVYDSIVAIQVTGILDAATEDALFTFQQLSGIPETGQLDKQTWKALALQYPLAAGRKLS